MRWPDNLVALVRLTKHGMCWISGQSVLGIPLDWPLRFVALGALYGALRLKMCWRWSVAVCVAVLLCTELFEIVAVRELNNAVLPNWSDVADILSGLTGMGAVELLTWRVRLIRRRRSQCSAASA